MTPPSSEHSQSIFRHPHVAGVGQGGPIGVHSTDGSAVPMTLKQYCVAGSQVCMPQTSPPSLADESPSLADELLPGALVASLCGVETWPELEPEQATTKRGG